MKRAKKLYVMLAVLALVCAAALIASSVKERGENIAVSGEELLAIPVESVEAFRWEEEGEEPLAFHREGERWVCDGDEDFPASVDKVEGLLTQFEAFGVGFAIEDADNLGDYGLAKPVARLTLETKDGEQTLELGDFSQMDGQRYVSVGDGKVYLAIHDPYEEFSNATLRSLIEDTEVPAMDDVQEVNFTGAEEYAIRRVEEGTFARPGDIWAVEQGGREIALDPDLVEGYFDLFTGSLLVNYADYHATKEELAAFGLDEPELTVEIRQGEESFALHIGLDPEEEKAWEKMSDKEREEADAVTAYAQVEGSGIVYELNPVDYEGISACGVDDLRHREVLSAEVEDVRRLEATVDGEACILTAQPEKEDLRWEYRGEKVDGYDLEDALRALRITDFGDFEAGPLELTFTVELASKQEIQVDLYRYDGDSCVAAVDGETLGLVDRADAMDLVETIRTVMLNGK